SGESPVVIEFDAGIEGLDAVVAAGELTVGEQDADVGLFGEVALHADDADFGTVVVMRVAGIERLAGGAIVDGQYSEIPSSQSAGEARAEFGIDDAPRKEQVLRSGEVGVVFQEEGALLGKLDFEALVDGYLRVVGFHLAEIGVEGDVERERIVQHSLGVE